MVSAPDQVNLHPYQVNLHPDQINLHPDLVNLYPDAIMLHPDPVSLHPDPAILHPDLEPCILVCFLETLELLLDEHGFEGEVLCAWSLHSQYPRQPLKWILTNKFMYVHCTIYIDGINS